MKNERKWVIKGTPYPLCQLTNLLVLSNFTFVPSLFEQTHSTEIFIQHFDFDFDFANTLNS